MQEKIEEFQNEIEFKRKFFSGIYICNICKKMTRDAYICTNCSSQANQLFSQDTYKFRINNSEVQQIFKPIELMKGD